MTSQHPVLGLIVAGSFLLTSATVGATVVASYGFNSASGASSDADSLSVAGTFTGSSGIAFSSNTARFTGNNNSKNTAPDDSANPTGNSYFEFIITPVDGQQLALDSLSFKFGGSSDSNGAYTTNFVLRSSQDSFASNIGAPVTVSVLSASTGASPTYSSTTSISLSALTSISDSLSGITLRFYIWESGGVANQATRIDDVLLNATISSVPEPSSYALGAGCLALGAVSARRNRRKG